MKVNFFSAVIGEIDDDDNNENKKAVRDYKLRCNVSFHSITLHLKLESVVEMFGAVVARCLLKQFYWIILLDGWSEMERQAGLLVGKRERWDMQPQSYQLMVGTIQFPITNLGRKKAPQRRIFQQQQD